MNTRETTRAKNAITLGVEFDTKIVNASSNAKGAMTRPIRSI